MASVQAIVHDWDALSVTAKKPFATPHWLLAWWRHVAPREGSLAIVTVFDRDRLSGVAPFFRERKGGLTRLRLLGAGTSHRSDLLARPDSRREVLDGVVEALAEERRRPDLLIVEGASHGGWVQELAASWQGSRFYPEWRMPAPFLSLAGRTYEEWFSSRSRNFRQQMRRDRRRLEAAGALFRVAASREELDRDLEAFSRLHIERWEKRGGSATLDDRVQRMLRDAGGSLISDGRFRLWSLEVNGRIVSSHLFLSSGGLVSYWLGGFDERWARFRPSIQTILVSLEHAWASGDSHLDLGAGDDSYKYRFADANDYVEWGNIVPPGPRKLQAASVARLRRSRKELAARLPANVRRLIRRSVRKRPRHSSMTKISNSSERRPQWPQSQDET